MNPGGRPTPALLALLLALSPLAQAAQTDWDGARGTALIPALPALPPPFARQPPRELPRLKAVPSVRFKGRAFKALQFSRSERAPETIVAALDLAQRSALLALYELKLPAAADAIIRAKQRGVDVRLIFDEGHAREQPGVEGRSAELQRVIDAGIEVRTLRGNGSYGIMHQKVAVLDGELLIGGSFNWTTAADERNYENLMLSDDPGIVYLYDADWRWMWGAAKPIGAAADFEALALGSPPQDPSRPVTFNGGGYPRAAFSPQGGIEPWLVDAIGRSRRSVEVAIFSFYSDGMARALVNAKQRGLRVSVIADAGQARRSPAIRVLRDAGIDLRITEGRGGGFSVMHHKFIVLDGRMAVNGSYNYSNNAESNNHENVLFLNDAGMVNALQAEQAAVFALGRVPTDDELPPLQ